MAKKNVRQEYNQNQWKNVCICAQVRETDIQMDGWNKLDTGRNQKAGKMIGFLSQKSAGKNVKQLVIKFRHLYTHALMF